MTWLAALIFMALALPPLLARLTGGHPPSPVPQLAALAPVAVLPGTAAVIIAAAADRWLAVPLAVPAVLLLIWQLPPLKRISYQAAAGPSCESGSALTMVKLRMLTVNARGGAADPAALLRTLRTHSVDVLAVQELTPHMVSRLAAAGLGQLLPFSHLDLRPGAAGAGLWARWPLTPLPPVPRLTAAAPRARISPPGGRPVTLTAVHLRSPMRGHASCGSVARADPADAGYSRRAAGGGRGLQRQPGSPPVPGSPAGRLPGLRRLQPAPILARIHLADRQGDTRHAPRSRAGLTDSHGAHDSRHTTTRYRSPWRAGRHRVHTGNLTVKFPVDLPLVRVGRAGPGGADPRGRRVASTGASAGARRPSPGTVSGPGDPPCGGCPGRAGGDRVQADRTRCSQAQASPARARSGWPKSHQTTWLPDRRKLPPTGRRPSR